MHADGSEAQGTTWWLLNGGKAGAILEDDGRWHIYGPDIGDPVAGCSPVNYATLREAQAWCRAKWGRKVHAGVQEGKRDGGD